MSELIQVEKFHGNQLWVITLKDGSRQGVDAWEQSVRAYISEFNNRSERYLVYDTTLIPHLGFTNYLQQRATALAYDNRDACGRVALVINLPPTMHYFFDIFVNLTGKRIQPNLDVKFFARREDAINWVAEILPE